MEGSVYPTTGQMRNPAQALRDNMLSFTRRDFANASAQGQRAMETWANNHQEMLAGFQTSIPPGATLPAIPIGGPPVDQAAVVAQLLGFLGSYTAVDQATLALTAVRPSLSWRLDARHQDQRCADREQAKASSSQSRRPL